MKHWRAPLGTSGWTALCLDRTAWTIDENRAETYVEGCQAADDTGGIWVCAYKKVEGEVVLEVEILKCSSVAGLPSGLAPLPSIFRT